MSKDSSFGGENKPYKMKRFFTLIVAACAFFATMAQHPMVTLSHNGEISFFTNLNAFNAALDSAKNGDVIYLSEGDFIIINGECTITKRVSIVGNGYGSHLLGNIRINMDSNPNSEIDAPLFDGIRLDKLEIFGSAGTYYNLCKAEIRSCWIRDLHNGGNCKEITYDKCIIERANFRSFQPNPSILVKNSKLQGYNEASNDEIFKIVAINCNISKAYYYPLTMISCIFKSDHSPTVASSSCSIINSVLDFTPSDSDVYTHECFIYSDENQPLLDDKLDCPLNLSELGYFGQDGTVVGIYGGELPFSENPSIPTVDTTKSSVEYDAENNKLKVSISVKAD